MSRRDKHAPNAIENYLMLHEKHLREREHFIVENGLAGPIRVENDRMLVEVRIVCRGNSFLQVEKTIQLLPNGWAKTIRYAYHGGVSFPENRAIFRFDNAHGVHVHHVFDPVNGVEIGLPHELTRDEWPHLSECLEMLEAWCLRYGICGENNPSTL